MDLLELSRLYAKASDEAYKAKRFKDEADLSEDEQGRDFNNAMHMACLASLEKIELKIQAVKLTIPIA